tara:strand:+ start:212 stop:421 length:210 start_codon:yes stop_codon:yes gene_type:complete
MKGLRKFRNRYRIHLSLSEAEAEIFKKYCLSQDKSVSKIASELLVSALKTKTKGNEHEKREQGKTLPKV